MSASTAAYLFPHFIITIHYYYHFIYDVSSNGEVVTVMTNKKSLFQTLGS